MARLIMSNLGPMLLAIKQEAETRFLTEFKSGTLDATKSLAYAAELRILEDIENRLRSKMNVADRVLNERNHEYDRTNNDNEI